MPTQTGEATLQIESAGPMTGVNLREDRVLIANTDLAKAINADLNIAPGSIVLRLGRTKLNPSQQLTDLQIRRQTLINGHRYQIAGQSIYRDFTRIANGVLSSNLSTNFQGYQPQADTQLWAFIADDNIMQKDNGTQLVPWTIAPPIVAPTAAVTGSGSLTGAYQVLYSYARKTSAGALAAESLPGPASLTVNPSSQVIAVSGIVPSNDPQVTHCRLYRTLAGGSLFQFDQDIVNGTTTATSSQADSSLGVSYSLTQNTAPPLASCVALWNETLWLTHDNLHPTYLWYSNRFNPEQFPPSNFLSIGDASDPLQYAVAYGGLLGVFSLNTKYRIIGNAVSGYHAEESMSRRGTAAFTATIPTEFGVVFVSKDGVWRTDFSSPDQQLSQAIYPLFLGDSVNGLDPINWNASNTFRAGRYKNRYYLAYASGSNTVPDKVMVYSWDTQKWTFYDHPLTGIYYEELNNQLLGGGQDGYVYILENGSSDGGTAISLDCETKDFPGPSKDILKIFQFMKIDADTKGDTLTCQLYVDDTLKTTQTFSSNGRTVKLLPVAAGCLGHHWRIKFTYTGTNRIRIYAPAMLFVPLQPA